MSYLLLFINLFLIFIRLTYLFYVFRWLSKPTMIDRYLVMYDELTEVHEHEDSNLPMDTSEKHLEDSQKLLRTLNPFDFVSRRLQTRHVTVTKARKYLNYVQDVAVPEAKKNNDFDVDDCRLSAKYEVNPLIDRKSDEHFEAAMIMLQKKKARLMTVDQLRASQKLLKNKYTLVNDEIVRVSEHQPCQTSSNNDDFYEQDLVLLRSIEKEADIEDINNKFFDASYVCASTAEVERLWSQCAQILRSNRTQMSKDLFEALIYLQYNRNYWGIDEVKSACCFDSYGGDDDDNVELEGFPEELIEGFKKIEIDADEDEDDYRVINLTDHDYESGNLENIEDNDEYLSDNDMDYEFL